tara:strand:- start:45 stop:611 length:567 start_codon:yes stop_codon:yes gene_type:complete
MNRNKNVETKNSQLDTFQSMLDAAGFVPGYGEPADILNAFISFARGDKEGAALSAFSAIPFLGYAGSVKKGEKLFGNVRFKKSEKSKLMGTDDERDYILADKDYAEALREPMIELGTKVRTKVPEIDVSSAANLQRSMKDIIEEYISNVPDYAVEDFMERDVLNIFERLAKVANKKDLFDVFRRAGTN